MDILISIDYEVSGDGKGDPDGQIIAPTGELLKVLSKFGLPATFFIEVEELQAFEKWQPRTFSRIRKQLDTIVSEGHEIALHLHPQWRTPSFNLKDKTFTLNPEHSWIMGVDDTGSALVEYLDSRRETLNDWLDAPKNNPCVLGFRAGGYSCQNYDSLLSALIEVGFSYDASALVGVKRSGAYAEYDYSNVGGVACVTKDFCLLPVSSWKSSKIENFSFKSLLGGRQSISKQGKQDLASSGAFAAMKKLFRAETRPLDWTTSHYHHFCRQVIARENGPYLSLIGHTKTVHDIKGIEKKLRVICDQSNSVETHTNYARRILPDVTERMGSRGLQ